MLRRQHLIVLCIVVPRGGNQPPGHGAVDLLADPLPNGAIARLGTLRLKHRAVVESMAFSPDGRVLASKSGKSMGAFACGTRPLASNCPVPGTTPPNRFLRLRFRTTGSRIAAAHATVTEKLADREIIVWDIATGLAVKVLPVSADVLQAMAFTGDDEERLLCGPRRGSMVESCTRQRGQRLATAGA